jgi:hypothetical protein
MDDALGAVGIQRVFGRFCRRALVALEQRQRVVNKAVRHGWMDVGY